MPNPNIRLVTLQWINNAMAGDEQLELWLKFSGTWALSETIPVASTAEQSHEFSFSPGDKRSFQIRARRDGEYRSDYQSANPDDWPSVSLFEHTAGMPTPVLELNGWARTSGVRQILGFNFSNIATARPVKFYVDTGSGWTLVDTIAAGTLTYDYEIGAESGTYVDFKIEQEDDDSAATPSNTLNLWAGPQAPTNLDTSPPTGYGNIWYGYNVGWTNGTGGQTRVEDDYCGSFTSRALLASGFDSYMELGLPKASAMDPNGNTPYSISVRVRHEYTSFAVTDYSDYTEATIPLDIASDEDFSAC